jgi:hypothetical protein
LSIARGTEQARSFPLLGTVASTAEISPSLPPKNRWTSTPPSSLKSAAKKSLDRDSTLELVVTHVDRRKHLPVFELRQAA